MDLHIGTGLVVTVVGLGAAMALLLAASRLVDLVSRRTERFGAGTDAVTEVVPDALPHPAGHVPGSGWQGTVTDGAGASPPDETSQAVTLISPVVQTPARSRSLHLHLRVAGNDYHVEVQPAGQAA